MAMKVSQTYGHQIDTYLFLLVTILPSNLDWLFTPMLCILLYGHQIYKGLGLGLL